MKTIKNKIITLLKFGIFLFGISFLLWNCKDEEDFQTESEQIQEIEQTNSTSYRITSLENIEKLQPVIQNIKKIEPSKHLELSRNFSFLNDIEDLNIDEIIEYTNETGYTTFNFKFNTTETSINFENLHLLETENGGYIAYILSYQPNEEWYYAHLNTDGSLNFDISTYQGDITKYSLEREVIWSTNSETASRGNSNTQARSYFYTFCVISPPPPCDEGNHGPGNWGGCAYSNGQWSETCQTVIGSGGGNYPDDDSSSSGGGTGANGEPCDYSNGTAITPDNEPMEGVSTDCTPNNNNGVSDSSATYDAFWSNLSYSQQNFLNQNSLIKNDVLYYLSQNQYAIPNQHIANNIIDFLAIPFPTLLNTTNQYKAEMLRMTTHLKQFGNPEDHNFANYVESLFPYLNSMTIGENSDLAYITYLQIKDLRRKYLRSILVPFAEAAYPFVVYAIIDATLGAAIPLLARIPLAMVTRGARLEAMILQTTKLGIEDGAFIRLINNSSVTKAEKLFTTLTKDAISVTPPNSVGTIVANMGNGNYITYRILAGTQSPGVIATIQYNFVELLGTNAFKLKFYP